MRLGQLRTTWGETGVSFQGGKGNMINVKIHRPKLTREQWEQLRKIIEKEISKFIVPDSWQYFETGEFANDFWFPPRGFRLK